ncbi:MAG TPA: hypothetical protein VIK01_10545 [Polyangiaceae bacterium]
MSGFKPSSRVSVCSLVAAAIACAWVAPAAAQAPGDAAMAESLFREGKRLSGEHKYSEACPRFEESFKLDHGLGTLLNLASCHESDGKLASAWAEFSEAVSQAKRQGDADRAQLAEDHMKALEPKLAHVSVSLAPGASVAGLVIKLDSHEVSQAALGVQIPVDPGKHSLEASAPGKQSYSQTFETPAVATVLAVTVPALQDAPVTGAPPAVAPVAPAASVAPSAAPAAPPAAAPAASSGSHTGVIVSGVATGAFVAATVVTGILYSGKRSDFNSANNSTDTSRFNKRDSAQTLGTVNLVCAGGALVSAGLLVYFLATSASHEAAPAASAGLGIVPLIAPNGGGLLLRGAL